MTIKRNYIPGESETLPLTEAGTVVVNSWQYFKLDTYFSFVLADIVVKIGGNVVDPSKYQILQNNKYTTLEATRSGKAIKKMIKFTDASLNGFVFSVSGLNFGTMLDNEAIEFLVRDVAGVKYPYTSTKDPSGFSCTDVTVTYNSTTRKITLTKGLAAELALYWLAELVPVVVESWESPAHPDINANYFLYYNGTDFVWGTDVWDFWEAQIAYVRYKGVSGDTFGIKETHGMGMSHATHQEFHEQVGTYVGAGGAFSGVVLLSIVEAERRPTVATINISDEDNHTLLPQLTGAAGVYCWVFLEGAALANFTADSTDIINIDGGTGKPLYNQNVGGVWQQTVMTLNHYQKMLVFAIPVSSDSSSQKYRYIWWQGQITSTTLAIIQSLAPSDFEFGDLLNNLTEVALIGEVIVRATNNNWYIQEINVLRGTKANLVSSSSSGATPSWQQVTEAGQSTTKNLILDATGKTFLDRVIGVYNAATDNFLWSVDGSGTMRVLAAAIGHLISSISTNYQRFEAKQKSLFGDAVDAGATATFTKPHQEEGFHFYSNKLSPVSVAQLFYTDQLDVSDGVAAFTNNDGAQTYYTYRGERTSGEKYWYVDTEIRTGELAFTNAMYRSNTPVTAGSIAPTDVNAYTGVSEAGYVGTFAYEDGDGTVGVETCSIIITDDPANQKALPGGEGGVNYAGLRANPRPLSISIPVPEDTDLISLLWTDKALTIISIHATAIGGDNLFDITTSATKVIGGTVIKTCDVTAGAAGEDFTPTVTAVPADSYLLYEADTNSGATWLDITIVYKEA